MPKVDKVFFFFFFVFFENPLKNKDARGVTTQNIDFSNTQGQITLQSEVGSGRNSN